MAKENHLIVIRLILLLLVIGVLLYTFYPPVQSWIHEKGRMDWGSEKEFEVPVEFQLPPGISLKAFYETRHLSMLDTWRKHLQKHPEQPQYGSIHHDGFGLDLPETMQWKGGKIIFV